MFRRYSIMVTQFFGMEMEFGKINPAFHTFNNVVVVHFMVGFALAIG